jgi:putative transport protein
MSGIPCREGSTGIVLGGFVGLLSVTLAGVPLALTASGGALIMGLVFGWLRSVRPFFGRIPEAAIWIFDTVGLCVFIGVVGITAGPGSVTGLQRTGVSLVIVGLICSLTPHIVTILFGRYVLRMNPLILLGPARVLGRSRPRSAPSRTRPRARCPRSATRCPTPSATSC